MHQNVVVIYESIVRLSRQNELFTVLGLRLKSKQSFSNGFSPNVERLKTTTIGIECLQCKAMHVVALTNLLMQLNL